MKKILCFALMLGLCGCDSNKEVKKDEPNKEESGAPVTKVESNSDQIAIATRELQYTCTCLKYEYVNEMTDDEIIRKAIEGVLSTLDPHTCYLDEKALNSFKNMAEGQFGGLGIEIMIEEGAIRIISPIDDTPAYKVGLKSGDLIIAIDSELVTGITAETALEKLRGEPGTKVKLKIKRRHNPPFDVTVTREMIKIQSVKAEVLDNIGYIRIATFDANTSNMAKQFLKDHPKLEGIILDVRNNPGGLLDAVVALSDLFLDDGKIVSIKGRGERNSVEFFATTPDMTNGLPIVVLINSGSASASEILAGALQDNGRAIVIGERSFGKGSVQKVIPISEKSAMKLTVAKYYTPSGRSIQGDGVSPDIEAGIAKVDKITTFPFREELLKNSLDNEEARKRHPDAKILPDDLGQDKDKDKNKEDDDEELKFRKMPLKERAEKDYQLNKAFDALKMVQVYKNMTKPKIITGPDRKETAHDVIKESANGSAK